MKFLHQWLRDCHLLFSELMRPRCSRPKDIGGAKFFKPESLTSGGLVLGVEPPRPTTDIVLWCAQIEVCDVGAHRAAETTGLIVERASNNEESPLECLVGFDPQKAFTQRDKTRNVQDGVGIQIVKLNPMGEEEPVEERMWGKRKSSEEKGEEKYPEPCRRSRDYFRPGNLDFRRIILQDANLCGILPVLLQELGLDPIAHRVRVSIDGLGFFRGSASGGAGGKGASLAHGGDAQRGTHREWEQICKARVVHEEEDDDGGRMG
jgi:hypothetical protein